MAHSKTEREHNSGESSRNDSTIGAGAARSATQREHRREYLRQYYQANREKAREYQRQYNLTYRKKQRVGSGSGGALSRPKARHTFTVRDIMQLPTEKAARAIDLICRGERMFTM